MILNYVRSEAYSMLDALTAKGIRLAPKQATVLSKLTQCCDSIVTPTDNTVSGRLDVVVFGSNTIHAAISGASPHDAAMVVAVNKIVPTVKNLQWLIKERVVPIARRVVEAVTKEVSETVAYGGLNFRVEFIKHSELLKNPLFMSLLDGYVDVGLSEQYPQFLQSFAPINDASELRSYLLTGVSRIDDQIVPVLTEVGDEDLIAFWNNYFVNQQNINLRALQTQLPVAEFERLMIRLFLICHNIISYDRFDNVSVGRSYILNACTQLAAMCATQLRVAIDRLSLIATTGELARAIKLPVDSKTPGAKSVVSVLVEEGPYLQFIQRGGRDEAVYGAVLMGRPLYLTELLDKQEEFEKAYAQHRVQTENTNRQSAANTTRLMTNRFLQEELRAPENKVLVANTSESSKKLYEEIEHLSLAQLEHLHETCADLVCRFFFPYTGAGRFMKAFNTLSNTYPELSGGEVARLATMEYVARYIVSLSLIQRS